MYWLNDNEYILLRYSTDYGMFHFCVANTQYDWREGTEQYKFIEHCFASVDRQKQPWLIFLAHWELGYSSAGFYVNEGSFEEPMGKESLQKLWRKYKVDISLFGHVHNYERTCHIYQVLTIASTLCLLIFACPYFPFIYFCFYENRWRTQVLFTCTFVKSDFRKETKKVLGMYFGHQVQKYVF